MERERGLLFSLNNKSAIERALWAMKMVLLCVGAISTATLFRVAVIPYVLDLSLSTVPQIWLSFRSSVSPFRIYLIINSIIAAIAFLSSTVQRRHRNVSTTIPKPHNSPLAMYNNKENYNLEKSTSWETFRIVPAAETEALHAEVGPPEEEKEKPVPVSSSSGDGGAGENEISSMDDTWKAIMEGQARQLERSKTTVERRGRLERAAEEEEAAEKEEVVWAREYMRKWETFNDRMSLRVRDKSMSPEELNIRSEAFIKKVNDDIRLQRLESDQRFMDMVNRGL